jgi:hypothetical protein
LEAPEEGKIMTDWTPHQTDTITLMADNPRADREAGLAYARYLMVAYAAASLSCVGAITQGWSNGPLVQILAQSLLDLLKGLTGVVVLTFFYEIGATFSLKVSMHFRTGGIAKVGKSDYYASQTFMTIAFLMMIGAAVWLLWAAYHAGESVLALKAKA